MFDTDCNFKLLLVLFCIQIGSFSALRGGLEALLKLSMVLCASLVTYYKIAVAWVTVWALNRGFKSIGSWYRLQRSLYCRISIFTLIELQDAVIDVQKVKREIQEAFRERRHLHVCDLWHVILALWQGLERWSYLI